MNRTTLHSVKRRHATHCQFVMQSVWPHASLIWWIFIFSGALSKKELETFCWRSKCKKFWCGFFLFELCQLCCLRLCCWHWHIVNYEDVFSVKHSSSHLTLMSKRLQLNSAFQDTGADFTNHSTGKGDITFPTLPFLCFPQRLLFAFFSFCFRLFF